MPYVDAPKTQIEAGDLNPNILIVSAQKETIIVKTLVDGVVDGLTKAGVAKSNIHFENVTDPALIPQETKKILLQSRECADGQISELGANRAYLNVEHVYKYDAVICVGIFIEEEEKSGEFDAKCEKSYNEVHEIILETNVPCILGILTCINYEQGLERAGIGRVEKGANHGYFWATAALSEIKTRKMFCEGESDTEITKAFTENVTQHNISKQPNVAILCAQWNMEINSEILLGIANEMINSGVNPENVKVYSAAGSYELPGLANYIIEVSRTRDYEAHLTKIQQGSGKAPSPVDAVVCVGSLIKGGTKHFKYIKDAAEVAIANIVYNNKAVCESAILCCKNMDEAKQFAGLGSEKAGESSMNIGPSIARVVLKKLNLV